VSPVAARPLPVVRQADSLSRVSFVTQARPAAVRDPIWRFRRRITAVWEANGAGKSTLIKLLCRSTIRGGRH